MGLQRSVSGDTCCCITGIGGTGGGGCGAWTHIGCKGGGCGVTGDPMPLSAPSNEDE